MDIPDIVEVRVILRDNATLTVHTQEGIDDSLVMYMLREGYSIVKEKKDEGGVICQQPSPNESPPVGEFAPSVDQANSTN